ncbi:MAG: Transposase [Chlamydiales bacterium]|jgi:predicted transposase YbfD/YdcC|nr:Transposase [Chlamydiales bacterium]
MTHPIDLFKQLPDPRSKRNQQHLLGDIIILAICAIMCGANDWVKVALYAKCQEKFFKQFLQLPGGTSSHDTFNRIFRMLDPKAFEGLFIEWTKLLAQSLAGKVVAIDGKTIRSASKCDDTPSAFHLVSAFVTSNELVLAQLKVEDKGNEITAIPLLIELLDLQQAIVTIDAMGCQKEIAYKICNRGADYILAVKDNQPGLADELSNFFSQAETDKFSNNTHCHTYTQFEKNRGRIEERSIAICSHFEWLSQRKEWQNLKTIICVKSTRQVKGKVSVEKRYYISSLQSSAEMFNKYIREHWGVENKLHWVLDVAYNEDRSKIRKDYGAENFALLRKITANLLKKDTHIKAGIESKRLVAGWDPEYLLKTLGVI